MSNPIKIQIQAVQSGTEMNFNSGEVILDLSVKIRVSEELFFKYKNKSLDVDDLNQLIENRI